MGIPSGFAAYAAGDPGRPGRGELRKPPTIVFCQYWKFNAIRDSLNLARAYPGVERGSPACVALDAFEKKLRAQLFCDLNIRAAA